MDCHQEGVTRVNFLGVRFKAGHNDPGLGFHSAVIAADMACSGLSLGIYINIKLHRLFASDSGLGIPYLEFQRIIACHHIFPY